MAWAIAVDSVDSSKGLFTSGVSTALDRSPAIRSASPVTSTTGVGRGRWRRRSRNSSPLNPGQPHVHDDTVNGDGAGFERLGRREADHAMPQSPQQAVQGIPDIVIVVDDRQRHRSG